MREIIIAEVGLDDEQRVFVQPMEGDFAHIYRAAMEVCWDSKTRRLSHPRPPRAWTPIQWFQQIVAAAADEYGISLKLSTDTIWIAVPADMRLGIEATLIR